MYNGYSFLCVRLGNARFKGLTVNSGHFFPGNAESRSKSHEIVGDGSPCTRKSRKIMYNTRALNGKIPRYCRAIDVQFRVFRQTTVESPKSCGSLGGKTNKIVSVSFVMPAMPKACSAHHTTFSCIRYENINTPLSLQKNRIPIYIFLT